MKALMILLLCFSAFSSFGQDWKEPLNEARKLYKKGNYKEALKYYKRADKLAPNDVDLSQEIGQTAYRAKDFNTASEQFESQASKAETKEKEVRARTSLGESRMKQQDYQSAMDAYKDVLRLDSENEKARQRLVEAKRLLEQKCKNKNKQEQEKENKDQQDQKNQDQKKNDQKNQNDKKDPGQPKDDQQNQNQQNQKAEQKKLQDKETERKLDEFSKQELSTKKRLDGSKGTTGGKKARKDW